MDFARQFGGIQKAPSLGAEKGPGRDDATILRD
jgi:hypothetical protein